MHRLFILSLAFILALGAALGVYLYVSLIPFFHEIGLAMTVLVIIGIACAATLLVSFTWTRIGRWGNQRNVIVAGEVVAFRESNGTWTHLSGIHQQMSLPPPSPPITITEDAEASDEVILELWRKGLSLRTIEKATGRKYHEIQKLTSAEKSK